MTATVFVQATAIAIRGRAVLLMGPPGCGKSDLALRLIGRGATLIADDGVTVTVTDHRLVAKASGDGARLHVAGIGIVDVARSRPTCLALAVTLDRAHLPRERSVGLSHFPVVDGWAVPQIALSAFEASAPDKLLLALDRWGH